MKKIFIIFIFLFTSFFCFTSCDTAFIRAVNIKNDSDFTVSFSLKNCNSTVYTLEKNETICLDIYSNPNLNFMDNYRISYASGANDVLISNLETCTYTVVNNSLYDIKLSENNNMIGDNYGDTIIISAPTIVNNQIVYNSQIITLYKKYPAYEPSWSAVYNGTNTNAIDFITITEN